MAPQSKKNSQSSPKKTPNKKKSVSKTAPKKTSIKKKPKKKSAKGSPFVKNISIVFGLLFIISLISFAYFLGQNEIKNPTVQPKVTKPIVKTSKKEPKIKKVVKKEKKREVKKPESKVSSKQENVTFVPLQNTKPKLVIIIDDVHTKAQINAIKALPVKVTPSIFPPYKLAPDSHLLVRGLDHYMIHLPMESGNKKLNTQYKTLKVAFSNSKIENRIKELRLLFPKAKFINNHTGSVFTSDYAAMHLAYKIMRENGFIFLDSKTINRSKVKEIAHAYGDVYVVRDIFIDNEHNVPYIHKQLEKAVKMAKKKGYAIAIGHPHATTLQALASAEEIFKDVELVYIDELYQ
jgi:polysaccharide deacetylase 2 family uncharacterized protein YibQ